MTEFMVLEKNDPCSDEELKHKEEVSVFPFSCCCLNRRWRVMHFTSSSHVSEHHGVTHVRILSLFTKVKESVNGERVW